MDGTETKIAPVDKFLACVHCGLCLSSCPTYLETGREAESPRGRIFLMKALEDGRVEIDADLVRHLDLCLGCRACETACPSGVEYGVLIEGGREYLLGRAPRSWRERRRRRRLARFLPEAARLRPLAALLRIASAVGLPRLATVRWLPEELRRRAALIPDPGRLRGLPEVLEPAGAPRATVALLTGCVASVFFSAVNDWTARLLVAAGYRVRVPREQTCCGALLVHLGERAAADRRAMRNLDAFAGDADFVVTNAAGCGAHLREYGRFFAADPERAARARHLAGRVRDVSELLAGALPPPTGEIRARVVYHDACHLAHGMGVRREPRDLLRSIPGLELLELADGEVCCGSAGTYNLTEPEMARRLGERKANAVLATGAEIVVAGNPGCILQIRAALRLIDRDLPVVHPVELLARAHGLT